MFTTALLACYKLYTPVLDLLDQDHYVVHYKWIGYLTFFILAALLAPIVFWPVIVPHLSDTFIRAMASSIEKD